MTSKCFPQIVPTLYVFQGHFVRNLGAIGDKSTENEVLLLEHDIPHHKWSEAVLDCLPKLPWVITEEVSTCTQSWTEEHSI